MRPLAIVDLDGPLLDVAARYFAAHRRALATTGAQGRHADSGAFWAAKRARAPAADLLLAGDPGTYAAAFRDRVEDDDLLALDALHPGALAALQRLAAAVDVHVLSLRTRGDAARRSVARLGVESIAPVTFVVHGPDGKVPAARALGRGRDVVAVIGDTEADAAVARALGASFVGVACGIRTAEALLAEGASFVGAGLDAAVAHVLAARDDRGAC